MTHGYMDTKVHGYKDKGYKDTIVQGCKDTRIQEYVQGYKNMDTRIHTEIHRYKNTCERCCESSNKKLN